MIRLGVRLIGADRLSDALSDGPQDVAEVMEQAGPEVRRLLGNAIANETNVDSTYLVTHEEMTQDGPYRIILEDIAEYATIVQDRYHFIDKGHEDADSAVIETYEHGLNDYAVVFVADSNINGIVVGLKTKLTAAPGISIVYDHRAGSIGGTPAIVFWVGPWKLLPAPYGALKIEWTIPGRIVVPYGNFETAEAKIRELLPGVIAAIWHALQLGGAITSGQAPVTSGDSGKIVVAKVPYHAMEFKIVAVEKFPFNPAK